MVLLLLTILPNFGVASVSKLSVDAFAPFPEIFYNLILLPK